MSFKFTLLGLEFSKSSPTCTDVNIEKKEKMAKKKSSKKQLAHREKFKIAVQSCHSSTKSKEAFGKCLSKKLTKKSSKKKR